MVREYTCRHTHSTKELQLHMLLDAEGKLIPIGSRRVWFVFQVFKVGSHYSSSPQQLYVIWV